MNNETGLAYPHIRGRSKTKNTQAVMFEQYHRLVSQFCEMQRDHEENVQRFIGFQEKVIATAMDVGSTTVCRNLQPSPSPVERQAVGPTDKKGFRVSGTAAPAVDLQPSGEGDPRAEKGDVPLVKPVIKRLVLRPVPASIDKTVKQASLSPGNAILLVGKKAALTNLIEKTLSDYKNPILHIVPGDETKVLGETCYQADLSSLDSIRELRNLIYRSVPGIAAIFILTGLTEAYKEKGLLDPFVSAPEKKSDTSVKDRSGDQSGHDSLQDAKELFLLLKVFIKDLKQSAQTGGACFINFSFMDGQFGLKKEHSFALGQAGSVGLTKAIARECPQVKVKCIDVDPSAAPLYVIARVKQELAAFDDLLEIGLDGKHRWKINVVEQDFVPPSRMPLQLDSDSVILATGGAYGIVSEVIKEIAARYGSRIIVTGRSPLPEAESPEIEKLRTFQDLQQFLIEKMKKEKLPVTPGVVLKEVQGILKARQIRENLDFMRKKAAAVEYHPIDVRDTGKFETFIKDIYEKWGRIDGVIHGAGVIEDKLIEAKAPEAFSRVFDTKVVPATILEKTLRQEELKFLIFFSSIAGRFGNIGQTDYCAANEILNKLADRLDSEWQSRVVSINWGPWDYGMVSDDLRKLFSERGIEMIPVDQGVKMFFDELNLYGKPESEVVVTGSLQL